MKFADYDEINAKLIEAAQETEKTFELAELFGNPFITILYRHSYDSFDTKKEKNLLFKSELENLFSDSPQEIRDNTLIADVTQRYDYAMGGGGGLYIPDLNITLQGTLTFIINKAIDLGADAALIYIGKKIFDWVKGGTKSPEINDKSNIKVLINNINTSYTFVFFHFFDKDTFLEAWEKMLSFKENKPMPEKGNQGVVIFDSKKSKWEVID